MSGLEIVHIAHKTRVSFDIVSCAACTWHEADDEEDILHQRGLDHEREHQGRTEPWEVFEPRRG